MNDTPKVSIILPFYNSKSTLEKAIQSIVNQYFKNFEFILIDNNSTDGGSNVAAKYSAKDSRISLFNEDKQGVVYAANTGLSKSTGTYIARMDADDTSFPNRLQDQVDLLDSQPEIGLVAGQVEYHGDDVNGGFIRYVSWSNSVKEPHELNLNQFVEYPLVNPTIMMRRTIYEKYGGYSEGDFPEDYEYFLRLQSCGVKMTKLNSVVLEWTDSPNRLTRTDDRYSQEAFFKIKAKYLAKWLEKNNPKHPQVSIWGAGKLARKRSAYLHEYGVRVESYIDIQKSNIPSVIYYEDVHSFRNSFILSFVTNWDAREEVREFLNQHSFVESADYLICA